MDSMQNTCNSSASRTSCLRSLASIFHLYHESASDSLPLFYFWNSPHKDRWTRLLQNQSLDMNILPAQYPSMYLGI